MFLTNTCLCYQGRRIKAGRDGARLFDSLRCQVSYVNKNKPVLILSCVYFIRETLFPQPSRDLYMRGAGNFEIINRKPPAEGKNEKVCRVKLRKIRKNARKYETEN